MSGTSEHDIQNTIRNALCDEGMFFRANVGQGWQGVGKPIRTHRPITTPLMPGDVLLKRARPFSTGLPTGFHDVFGVVPVVVTPDMVGQTVGVFASFDAKSAKGRASEPQVRFAAAVVQMGGRSGFARSVDEALRVIRGEA